MLVNSAAAMNIFGMDTFHVFSFTITDSVCLASDQIPYEVLSQLYTEFASLFVQDLGCAKNF